MLVYESVKDSTVYVIEVKIINPKYTIGKYCTLVQ